MNGFVKLHRQFLEWEWYKHPNTQIVFIYLLLTANFKEAGFMGQRVKPGQRVTSVASIAGATGLTTRKVRTALEHLQSTGEISIKTTSHFSLITIEKWRDYQGCDEPERQTTDKQTTNDRQATDKQPTTNEEGKKEKRQEGKNGGQQQHQEIVDAWNALGLNPIRSIKDGTTRLSLLNARLKGYGEEAILEAIEEVRQSEFLQGANTRGWTITFDWLLKPNNFQKVLEGQYRTKLKPAASNSTAEMLENHYRMAEEWANEYKGI